MRGERVVRKTRPRIAHTNPAGAGRALAVLSKVLGQRGPGEGWALQTWV